MIRFLYPPYCRHCDQKLEKHALLCKTCLSHLNWSDVKSVGCILFYEASVFVRLGPILSLLPFAKTEPSIAKLFASFMVYYQKQLDTPPIDGLYFASDTLLAREYRALTKQRRRFFAKPEETLFVPTLKPLTYKQKKRILKRVPSRIVNLSIV